MALSTGGMELPNAPSWTGGDATDLERGDVAFVFDALGTDGSLYAPWVCLDAGTLGGLDAVWNRVSSLSSGGAGIRDAHVIVVAHQNAATFNLTTGVPATDTLLQINPQVAGVAVDYVDTGDGTQLALALAAAQAMLATNVGRVDVRMRPCDLRLDSSFPPLTTITVPENVRLIGAGSGLSRISGWSIGDQTVFNVQGKLSGWEISSPEPTATTSGSAGGVVIVQNASGTLPIIEDLIVSLGVSVDFARTQRVGIQVSGDGYGGPQIQDCFIRQIGGANAALSHFTLFGTDLIGIQVAAVQSDKGVNIHDVSIEGYDVALDVFGSNEVRASNLQATDLFRYGLRYQNSFFPADCRGISVCQALFSFHATEATATTAAVRVAFSQDGTLTGPVLTSVRVLWPSTVSTNRYFIDVLADTAGRIVRALQAVNCTIDPSPSSAAATVAVNLDAAGGGSIRGGITTSDIGNAATPLVSAGTVTWVQANLL